MVSDSNKDELDIEIQELLENGEYNTTDSLYSEEPVPKNKVNENIRVGSVIIFYGIVSLSVVYLNKYLLGKDGYLFSYPFTLTLFQFIIALILCFILGELNKNKIQPSSWNPIPPFEFDFKTAKKVAPLTFIYVGMLALSNLCLAYSKITYYQVAKSLTIIFTIIFTFLILKKTTSKLAIMASSVIFVGFILGNLGEEKGDNMEDFWIALFSGIGSSVLIALYGIFIKKTLKVLHDNEWKLLIFNTTISIMILFPICLVLGEFTQIWEEFKYLLDWKFWFFMVIAGIIGFLINIATFLAVKITSPLTFTVMGTAKAGIQTALAPFIFDNPVSLLNGVGIAIVLLGSGFYSFVKYRESNRK